MTPDAFDALSTTGVIHGRCDHRFADVAAALTEEINTGGELGAAIAVDVDGELVVDIWGGYADKAKTVKWTENTIVNVFSSTKNVTALAALILIDRGLLDPFAPVAKYWPEFAANGKQDIEVRHILSHTSGVSGWEAPFTLEDLYDWEKSTALLAAQAPWWPPGTASGYHAVSLGHLVGEVVRRITGKTLKQFVHDEIAEPLDADIQIGAQPADDDRIAELIPPPPLDVPLDAVPEDHPMRKTFGPIPPNPKSAESATTIAWRRADIGSANGHGNARSLARALSPISLGGKANGVRLLSPDTIDLIFQEQANGIDLVLAMPLRWGIGYALPKPEAVPDIPDEKTEALKTGEPQSEVKLKFFDEIYSDPAKLEQFMQAISGLSRVDFETLAARFDFGRYRSVCDVGGATGRLCRTLAGRYPAHGGLPLRVGSGQAPVDGLPDAGDRRADLLDKPGSVVLWTNCRHPFYDHNSYPQAAPPQRPVWVGDFWDMFGAGHALELQNHKAIAEYRHRNGLPLTPAWMK